MAAEKFSSFVCPFGILFVKTFPVERITQFSEKQVQYEAAAAGIVVF